VLLSPVAYIATDPPGNTPLNAHYILQIAGNRMILIDWLKVHAFVDRIIAGLLVICLLVLSLGLPVTMHSTLSPLHLDCREARS